ncbi:MAG: 50S ribosomal protein L24 [Candidatus Omnitrophica bacterium]|nr:50S ribosomal protein L24 [Candidatus Omnitrophota bacterium]
MASFVRRDDLVQILSGRDKGKKGKILQVMPAKARVVVQGIHFVKRAMRPSKDFPQGGIQTIEGSIHISNVVLVCPRCSKGTRARRERRPDGNRVRVCKKCGEEV